MLKIPSGINITPRLRCVKLPLLRIQSGNGLASTYLNTIHLVGMSLMMVLVCHTEEEMPPLPDDLGRSFQGRPGHYDMATCLSLRM